MVEGRGSVERWSPTSELFVKSRSALRLCQATVALKKYCKLAYADKVAAGSGSVESWSPVLENYLKSRASRDLVQELSP